MAEFPLKKKLVDARKNLDGSPPVQRMVSDEGGLFGVGSVIAALILIGVTVVVLSGFKQIMRWIAGQLSLGKLLVHIPPFDPEHLRLVTFPELSAEQTQGIFHASTIMSNLYMTFVTVSFAVLTIAFVAIGLSYALEGFDVIPPDTANKLLSESVLVLILIFIFPWFFNAGAVALNALDENVIMHEGDTDYREMARYVASEIGNFPGLNVPKLGGTAVGAALVEKLSSGFVGLVLAVATFTALVLCVSIGVFKILALVTFAVAFPILLTLRLIPITRNLANRLIQGLLGVLVASLVIALFFRFGWGLLHAMNEGVMRWAVAVSTLIASAGALTITARVFYGITRMTGGAIGRSVAGAAAGYVASGATAGLGGAMGMAMGGKWATAGVRSGGMGGGQALRTVGRAGIAGTAAGGPGKSITGSMGKGFGAGDQVGRQKLAENMPYRGDIEQTQMNITGHMDAASGNIQGMNREPTAGATSRGAEIADVGVDGLSDRRVLDAYGKWEAHQGKMREYDPNVHRDALAENVSPDEIKRGLKGSLAKMKDRYDTDTAHASLAHWLHGPDKEGFERDISGGE